MSLRTLTRFLLPPRLKRSVQQVLFGYHSYAPSFSSAGEDMILRHLVGSDKQDGFFVDVGAYDPVISSNTHFFSVNGWHGINIEARPGSRRLFDRVRPRDVNIECGIATSEGKMNYYFVGENSTMNSFSREFLEHIDMLSQVQKVIEVPVLPLRSVLQENLPTGQTIDFMTVDIEGHDLQALESNDWQRFRPRFVVVEDATTKPEDSAIVSFMRTQGYDVCAQNVIILDKINEYFFVNRRG
ncbi:MAG TPA: FkbM family methyltransferase [Pyrinomonadaceae bacterium]|nr:FkbM family methyltransferase [Pyrinomonadaceae bacterium]